MNLFDIEREKYWAFPVSYSRDKMKAITDQIIYSNLYLCSEKKDGNWCAFVKQDGVAKMQSRGRSTVTKEFVELQEKVPHIFESLNDAFSGDCFIIGELYVPGGNDKTVGSIIRCLPEKAIKRQEKEKIRFYIFDCWYLDGRSYMNSVFSERIETFDLIKNKIRENPYIEFAEYHDGAEAYSLLAEVLSEGGEGVVLQRSYGKPEPGKRPARKSLKLKKEIQQDIDVICTGFNPPTRIYNGKELGAWVYWEDIRTGEKLLGELCKEYTTGSRSLEPITKNYYYGWPGSIECSAYKDGDFVKVCDVSGLTDEIKQDIHDHPRKYEMRPLRITGMESTADNSIRHPKFLSFRDDIDIEDCNWNKIFGH